MDGLNRGHSISPSLPIAPASQGSLNPFKASKGGTVARLAGRDTMFEAPPLSKLVAKNGNPSDRSSSREVRIRVPTFFCGLL